MMRPILMLIIISFCFPRKANTCGFYLLGEDYRIALLNPYLAGNDYARFFYSSEHLNHADKTSYGADRRANVKAWAKELGVAIPTDAVFTLIYGSSLKDWVKADQGTPTLEFQQNPAWRVVQKRPEIMEYLLWAKAYERPDHYSPWDRAPEEDTFDAYRENMPERAQEGYKKAPASSFLKKRWAYQLLLVARYEDRWQDVQRLYEMHFAGMQDILSVWASFQAAPAWSKEGKRLVAYANAFAYAPEKALPAYNRSLKNFDPEEYMAFVSSNEEAANLYILQAVKTPGKALIAIQNVYELAPEHPLIDLLLVREVNKLEDWLMTFKLTDNESPVQLYELPEYITHEKYHSEKAKLNRKVHADDRRHLKRLRSFLAEYEARPGQADFLRLLRAHTALMDDDYHNAIRLSSDFTDKSSLVANQARVIRYLATLQVGNRATETDHEYVSTTLSRLMKQYPNNAELYRWEAEYINIYGNAGLAIPRITSRYYEERGDTAAAFLLHNMSNQLPYNFDWISQYYRDIDYLDRKISSNVTDKVIAILQGDLDHDPLYKYLKQTARVSVNAIRDVAGTEALRQNDPDLAVHYFEAIPSNWYADSYEFANYLNHSPFVPPAQTNTIFPGKLTVAQRLADLKRLADTGDIDACHQLGIAWSNMGYHGNSWMMLTYGKNSYGLSLVSPWPKTSSSHSDSAYPHESELYSLVMLNERAIAYLECAAAGTNDPEVLAKIGFQLLELELNSIDKRFQYEEQHISYKQRNAARLKAWRDARQQYADNYRHTSFFSKVRMSCNSLAGK